MGTQGPGRKRIPNKERLTAEDDALNVIAREVSTNTIGYIRLLFHCNVSFYHATPSRPLLS